jgi:hypothetical protein
MTNAVATLGLSLWYILKGCLALVAFVGAGSLWPRTALARQGPALGTLLAAALGMGWIATVLMAFGLMGAWSPWLTGGILLACGCRGAWWMCGAAKHGRKLGDTQCALLRLERQPRWLTGALIGISAIIGANCLLGALAPDSQQDSLWYHLSCARAWVEWGTLRAWPQVWPSSYSLHGSVLYAAALMLGDEVDCSVVYAMQGFLCYGIAALFAAKWFGRAAGVWTWFLCATAHAANVWFVPINTGSDLTVAMFSAAGLLLFADALIARDGLPADTAGFLASALLIGFAVSTKVTALGFAYAPWALGVAWFSVRGPLRVRTVLAGIGLACVPFALWAVRGWLVGCGNPFFPLFRHWIPLRPGFVAAVGGMASGSAEAVNDVYPLSAGGLAMALAEMPRKLGLAAMSRSPGYILHAFAVAGFFSRVRVIRALAATAILQWGAYLWSAGNAETVKYFAQCFPAVFVVLGCGVAWFVAAAPAGRAIRLGAAVAAIVMLAGIYGSKQLEWGAIPNVGWRYRPVLTQADRVQYLSGRDFGLSRIGEYEWINRSLPRDAVVLFADTAYPLYVRRQYLWSDPGLPFPDYLARNGVTTRDQVGEWFSANGVSHVIASPNCLKNWPEWGAILHRPAEAESPGDVWTVANDSARGMNRTKPANSAE